MSIARWPYPSDIADDEWSLVVAYLTTTLLGNLMFGVTASFAAFERELIRERTTAGIAAARRRGKKVGRPLKLSSKSLDVAGHLLASKRQWRDVAAALDVSKPTLRDGLNRRKAEMVARLARQRARPLETYLARIGSEGGEAKHGGSAGKVFWS